MDQSDVKLGIQDIPELVVHFGDFASLRTALLNGEVDLGIDREVARQYFAQSRPVIALWYTMRPFIWLVVGIVGTILLQWWFFLIALFFAIKSIGLLQLFGLEAPLNTKAYKVIRRDLLEDEHKFALAYTRGWLRLKNTSLPASIT